MVKFQRTCFEGDYMDLLTRRCVFDWLKKVIPQPPGISVPASAKAETEPALPENKVPEEEKVAEVKVIKIKEEVPRAVTIIEVAPAEPTLNPITSEEKQPMSEAMTKTSVFGWLIQGLGKVVPQPVTKSHSLKEDVAITTACTVEERGKPVLVSETKEK
ncbi:cyclic nucleotide-gated channel beta-1-like [Narcine bancroftii]|uniref:cyclic nucleotide-gated channel beta-1-like n=1 Tax=Narcine bancroftii TaxID=1343680 RepID=UPI003831A8EB